jgi:hypothetical protein
MPNFKGDGGVSGGGADDVYDDDEFQEDVAQGSDEEGEGGLGDSASEFEEGLDEGDARYDDIDGGGLDDGHGDDDVDGNAYDEEVWDVDVQDDAHEQRQQHQSQRTRPTIILPPAAVDAALASNATSLLTLAAFDVFLLSLM